MYKQVCGSGKSEIKATVIIKIIIILCKHSFYTYTHMIVILPELELDHSPLGSLGVGRPVRLRWGAMPCQTQTTSFATVWFAASNHATGVHVPA